MAHVETKVERIPYIETKLDDLKGNIEKKLDDIKDLINSMTKENDKRYARKSTEKMMFWLIGMIGVTIIGFIIKSFLV